MKLIEARVQQKVKSLLAAVTKKWFLRGLIALSQHLGGIADTALTHSLQQAFDISASSEVQIPKLRLGALPLVTIRNRAQTLDLFIVSTADGSLMYCRFGSHTGFGG